MGPILVLASNVQGEKVQEVVYINFRQKSIKVRGACIARRGSVVKEGRGLQAEILPPGLGVIAYAGGECGSIDRATSMLSDKIGLRHEG